MKKNLHLVLLLLCVIFLLSSCATSQNTVSEDNNYKERTKENNSVCFVQLKDGSIVNYTSLKLVNAVFNDAYLLADNKTRIYPKQIKAYQNKDHYAVAQNSFASGRKTYVSVEALPGFAVRIAKGKLNIYCKKFYNGSHAVDEFFIQSGDNGPINAYDPQLMNDILKGKEVNSSATVVFTKKIKYASLSKKLLAAAALVNNDPMAFKN